ncbi:hypothetical protein [Albimonas pacifica]|uniref:Uncharacterized protein n=1 Tax=Albimonas pacifica TaxID=1114924 RepID=A0A1I3QNG4_9RHOB|nr:hypothetical protein [Albimonas pacifica]SFJ34801.1 hypothetical protein SAMN05216258_1502 [Albimonas pacifica]
MSLSIGSGPRSEPGSAAPASSEEPCEGSAPGLQDAPSSTELDRIAFDRLLARATPDLSLQILADGEPRADGRVAEGESIVVRLDLPEALDGAQGILLTRNEAGDIRLLSNVATTSGALRWRRRLEVPRQDASLDGSGPTAWLRFEGEGRHEILAVLTPSRRPRFDRHAIFGGPTAGRDEGSHRVDRVPAGALWDLVARAGCGSSPLESCCVFMEVAAPTP